MIGHISIAATKIDLGEDIKKYIGKKLGKLDKYMPRKARSAVYIEVKLVRSNEKSGNQYECEAIVHLPGLQLQAKEATLNMFAAVDIVEAKIKNQLLKYKDEYAGHLKKQPRPGLFARLRGRFK